MSDRVVVADKGFDIGEARIKRNATRHVKEPGTDAGSRGVQGYVRSNYSPAERSTVGIPHDGSDQGLEAEKAARLIFGKRALNTGWVVDIMLLHKLGIRSRRPYSSDDELSEHGAHCRDVCHVRCSGPHLPSSNRFPGLPIGKEQTSRLFDMQS
jgi:hypothetical protein